MLIFPGIQYYEFNDLSDRPVHFVDFSQYVKSELTPKVKQQSVHVFDKCDRKTTNEGWAMVLDASMVTLLNVDIDTLVWLGNVLMSYYPRGFKYVAIVDTPVLIYALAIFIVNLLNEEIRSRVIFITRERLPTYLDQRFIPEGLKYNNDTYAPINLFG